MRNDRVVYKTVADVLEMLHAVNRVYRIRRVSQTLRSLKELQTSGALSASETAELEVIYERLKQAKRYPSEN